MALELSYPTDAIAPASTETIPPPLPPRPVQWRRSWQLLRELVRDTGRTEKVFELFDALGGQGDEPTFQSFIAHPDGRRLLIEKPVLIDALADRAALARLPDGSLGRAYLDFARRNGFPADGIKQANERGLGHLNAQLDAQRNWFFDRVGAMHDLWHVLTGYGTDEAGEAALLAFSIAQGLASRTLRVLLVAAAVMAPKRDGFAFQRYLRQAFRRGRAASPLFVQRYEKLLAQPLGEVRAGLGIVPAHVAHPEGVFRGSRQTGALARVAVD